MDAIVTSAEFVDESRIENVRFAQSQAAISVVFHTREEPAAIGQ